MVAESAPKNVLLDENVEEDWFIYKGRESSGAPSTGADMAKGTDSHDLKETEAYCRESLEPA